MYRMISFKQLRTISSFKAIFSILILVGIVGGVFFGDRFFSQISLVQPAFASPTGSLSATANPCQIQLAHISVVQQYPGLLQRELQMSILQLEKTLALFL